MVLATIAEICSQNVAATPELISSLCLEYIESTLIKIGSNSCVDILKYSVVNKNYRQ